MGENKEKIEPLCTLGGNVYWHSHCQNCRKCPWKLKMQLPCDPAILLVGIDLKNKNTNLKRYLYSRVHCCFIYNSLNLEKPKCPSANKWIIYTNAHTLGYYSAINLFHKWNSAIYSNGDWPRGFPGSLVVKKPRAKAGDVGSIPDSGRSSGEDDNPLQYSCLGNPMNRRTWRARVCGVAKEFYMT